MLTRLRFTNFKAWRDSGEIRLAPLTVLFGANSAGKTSIPQLLLLLKQTADSPDRRRVLQLGDSRSGLDLGSYDDVVHHHETERPLEIDLHWRLADPLAWTDPASGAGHLGRLAGFRVVLEADDRRQPFVRRFHYSLDDGADKAIDVGMVRVDSGAYELRSATLPLDRRPGRGTALPPPERFYGFPREAMAGVEGAFVLVDLVLELERMLRSIHHVGPLREYPRRLYHWSGEAPDHVGVKGERAIHAILAAEGRTFAWAAGGPERPLAELIAARLQAMGLISDFRVQPVGEGRREYEVLVRTGSRRPEVRLVDVGIGVSQVLPVLVETLFVPPGSIVVLEQPELHLHPRVQSELADVFVDAIAAHENGRPRGCQFIIESHSEHLLRRLQRRIAEGVLNPDDAALYFVRTDEAEASLERLQVDPYGNITNWPPGFFGDEMVDLVARAEAQARRRAAQRGERDE